MLLKNKQKNKIKYPSLSFILSQACLRFLVSETLFLQWERGGGGLESTQMCILQKFKKELQKSVSFIN